MPDGFQHDNTSRVDLPRPAENKFFIVSTHQMQGFFLKKLIFLKEIPAMQVSTFLFSPAMYNGKVVLKQSSIEKGFPFAESVGMFRYNRQQ
jgi:hypothetical protein